MTRNSGWIPPYADRQRLLLLLQVDCSTHFDKWASHKVVHNSGCLSDNVYDSYVGQCKCASLDASEE
eukprot:28692-Eustigmatos_ZCMA.PRE.1